MRTTPVLFAKGFGRLISPSTGRLTRVTPVEMRQRARRDLNDARGEEPDQVLDVAVGAVRDRRSDDDVGLSGPPSQQRLERGEQHGRLIAQRGVPLEVVGHGEQHAPPADAHSLGARD